MVCHLTIKYKEQKTKLLCGGAALKKKSLITIIKKKSPIGTDNQK